MELRVNKIYKFGKKIGSGSFGDVYLGANVRTNEEVAIKIESRKKDKKFLIYEAKVIKVLTEKETPRGFPKLHWYGIEGDFSVMITGLLGPSLEDLFNFCRRKFSLKTVSMIAEQLLNRIESVHTGHFLHRDIKPDNFLIGVGRKSHIIHVIDFNLSKRYRDPKTLEHIPYKEDKNLTGTARYASINTHIGIEQCRRDDLESLGFVLVYFLKGRLPWQGIKAKTKQQKYERIMEKKMCTPLDSLCKDLPKEFITYFKYVRSLRFEDRPDYIFLRRLFQNVRERQGTIIMDHEYDWCIGRKKRSIESPEPKRKKRKTEVKALQNNKI